MHKLEFVLENETHKILWDFEIQTDYRIPDRIPDLGLIKKKIKLVDWRILPFQQTLVWK